MYVSLIYLRAIAPLLVFYDHIIGIKYSQYSMLNVHTILTEYIIIPFGIIQDFGFLGVAIFFILSGFIMSHIVSKESLYEFAIKRILRIYPALIVSILIIYILSLFFSKYIGIFEFRDIFLSMSLLNYISLQNNPIQGVAWTLIIEILFYILFGFFYFITKNLKRTFILLSFSIFLIIEFSRSFGPNFFLFAASISYIPFLMSGILIYSYKTENKISIVFIIINIFLILFSLFTIHNDFLVINNSYLINYIYAVCIFLMFIFNENKFKKNKLVVFFNNISYSFYLYHGFIGYLIIDLFFDQLGVVSIIMSFIVATIISYLSYLFVENTMNNLGKKILKRNFI